MKREILYLSGIEQKRILFNFFLSFSSTITNDFSRSFFLIRTFSRNFEYLSDWVSLEPRTKFDLTLSIELCRDIVDIELRSVRVSHFFSLSVICSSGNLFLSKSCLASSKLRRFKSISKVVFGSLLFIVVMDMQTFLLFNCFLYLKIEIIFLFSYPVRVTI